jgi:tripartite-type tricarboxylate transporter receptor subunit TctC
MTEQGIPNMTTGSWQGIFVPKGAPQPVVSRLYAASIKTMADPDVRKRLAAGGVDAVTSKSPKDFAAFVKAETDRFGKVIKDAGVTAE